MATTECQAFWKALWSLLLTPPPGRLRLFLGVWIGGLVCFFFGVSSIDSTGGELTGEC